MRAVRIALSAIFALGAATAAALATPVSVANPSFETLPGGGLGHFCGTDCAYSVGLPIPGWTITGSQTGQLQPGSDGFYFNSVPDGATVAYTNHGTISQTVSAAAVAGQSYLLQVDLGFRKDAGEPGTVLLKIGSNSVSATGAGSQNSGNWSTYAAFWIATLADDGQAITIVLASTTPQGDFDNVRLDTFAPLINRLVAEPLSFAVFGAGLMGMATLRRRRISER